MRGRTFFQVILGLVLVGGLILVGGGLYQAGYAAGAAGTGGPAVAPPFGYGWGWHGGFGLFGFLGFFLFLLLLFALFRAIAWGGRGWRGGLGGWGPGPGGWGPGPGGWGPGPGGWGPGPGHDHPGLEGWRSARQAWFDEWHRRAHEAGTENRPGQNAGGSGTAGPNPS